MPFIPGEAVQLRSECFIMTPPSSFGIFSDVARPIALRPTVWGPFNFPLFWTSSSSRHFFSSRSSPYSPYMKESSALSWAFGIFCCCPRLNWWPEPAAQSQQRFSRVIAPVFDACLVVAPIIRCLTCFKRRKIPFEFDVGRSSIKRTVVVLFSRRSIQHDVHLSSQHGYTSRA